ncbi:MAG: hypothetical protein ACK53Y_23920 [bacterium]
MDVLSLCDQSPWEQASNPTLPGTISDDNDNYSPPSKLSRQRPRGPTRADVSAGYSALNIGYPSHSHSIL